MKINKEFEDLIEKRYKEMQGKQISEDYLNKDTFGELKVFIGKKPKYSLFSIKRGSDQIYFGSESI